MPHNNSSFLYQRQRFIYPNSCVAGSEASEEAAAALRSASLARPVNQEFAHCLLNFVWLHLTLSRYACALSYKPHSVYPISR